MDSIEKRARKALAHFYRARGRHGMAALVLNGHVKATDAELSVVIEYLTPPEGYVLVPVEPTEAMIEAAEDAHMPFGDMGFSISAAIAARPEVNP